MERVRSFGVHKQPVGSGTVALGEYIEVSATCGGLTVVGEDATAWGKGTTWEENRAWDTPDCHGGRGKASL